MAGPHVTDHAMLRFLERGGGFDIEELRARMEASLARAHAAARSLSVSDYLVRIDGLTFLVRGEAVVTVFPEGTPGMRAATIARASDDTAAREGQSRV